MFKEAHARILLDEETGVRPDLRVKLVYVASKFRICKSINSNATLPGWYDICLELSGASVSGISFSSSAKHVTLSTRLHRPQQNLPVTFTGALGLRCQEQLRNPL